MTALTAMQQYKQVGVEGDVMDATPHKLVQLLMEGVLEKIALAKGNMLRREIAEKGENIGSAITILGGLRASLDLEAGGELAQNLDDLYDYMTRQLLAANLNGAAGILDEVSSLMAEVKSGWDAIASD
ncbi:MAG: flagellar export chaperone FliS [Gammaproteobacteria bacterium]